MSVEPRTSALNHPFRHLLDKVLGYKYTASIRIALTVHNSSYIVRFTTTRTYTCQTLSYSAQGLQVWPRLFAPPNWGKKYAS